MHNLFCMICEYCRKIDKISHKEKLFLETLKMNKATSQAKRRKSTIAEIIQFQQMKRRQRKLQESAISDDGSNILESTEHRIIEEYPKPELKRRLSDPTSITTSQNNISYNQDNIFANPPSILEVPFDLIEFTFFDRTPDEHQSRNLKQLIMRYESNLVSLQTNLGDEKKEHKQLKYKTDQLFVKQKSVQREIRDCRAKSPRIQEKIRAIKRWFNQHCIPKLEKEAERSKTLIELAQRRLLEQTNANKRQIEMSDKINKNLKQIQIMDTQSRDKAADVRIACYEHEEAIKAYNTEITILELDLAQKRIARDEILQRRVIEEKQRHELENGILTAQFEKRKLQETGKILQDLLELDLVDFSCDANIKVLPQMLQELPQLKYLCIDASNIKDLKGLDAQKNLLVFSAKVTKLFLYYPNIIRNMLTMLHFAKIAK